MVKQVITADGSCSAYSREFGEHYHSTKEGALKEALYKHVLPAFELKKHKNEVHILDICFGLGINTLATIYHYQKYAPHVKLFLYSPEFDKELVASLVAFEYPDILQPFVHIIHTLVKQNSYVSKNIHVELFLGDAREYITKFKNCFDIVYQDAFSPKNNPLLWTKEYFGDIKTALKPDGILTSYSTALQTRLALDVNGFYVYLLSSEGVRNFTLASLRELGGYEKVDMKHKKACNPTRKPLSDTNLGYNIKKNSKEYNGS